MSSCFNLAVRMGGVQRHFFFFSFFLKGRIDIKFITLAAPEGAVRLNQTRVSPNDENLRFCFTGAVPYLNWVIAKENARLRRGVNVVKQGGEKKKQEWELCQTFLKENHAIKPQNQLIGRCYP